MNVLSVLPPVGDWKRVRAFSARCGMPSTVVYKRLASRLVSSESQQTLDLLEIGKPLTSVKADKAPTSLSLHIASDQVTWLHRGYTAPHANLTVAVEY